MLFMNYILELRSVLIRISEELEIEHEECGDVLDVVEREWLGETILRSTVQCERCNFLFDHLDFQLGLSECPSCFSKELKLVKQKKEIVE